VAILKIHNKIYVEDTILACLVWALRLPGNAERCIGSLYTGRPLLRRKVITDGDLYDFAENLLKTPNCLWSLTIQEAAKIAVNDLSSLELFRQEVSDLSNYEMSILRRGTKHHIIGYF
jgi:hypothetical protein